MRGCGVSGGRSESSRAAGDLALGSGAALGPRRALFLLRLSVTCPGRGTGGQCRPSPTCWPHLPPSKLTDAHTFETCLKPTRRCHRMPEIRGNAARCKTPISILKQRAPSNHAAISDDQDASPPSTGPLACILPYVRMGQTLISSLFRILHNSILF